MNTASRDIARTKRIPRAAVLTVQELRGLLRFIQENLPVPITLDCLAALVRMDKFQFVRAFGATTGSTPHKYVVRMRVERATHLLETTTARLSAIALCCGFCSHSYFTTVFREHVGLSPQAYRRRAGVNGPRLRPAKRCASGPRGVPPAP